jgi:hypothetical protein
MHVPPQLIWLPGQATEQVPFPQTLPAGQDVPGVPPPLPHKPVAPQLLALVLGSMQTPPQLICVPGHDTLQAPALHTFPFVHARPALPPPFPQSPVAPQLVGLVSGSTQIPPQFTWLPGHDISHDPALQTLPLLHAVPAPPPPLPQRPDAPQFDRLVSGSMHVPPQLTSLPGHET